MTSRLFSIRWPEALPRLFADYAIVHLSFLLALLVSAAIAIQTQPWQTTAELTASFRHLYLAQFLPLSLLFPPIFLATGFYSHSRAYPMRYKMEVLLRGSAAASLCYLALHFIFNRADDLPRSTMIGFFLAMAAGIVSARLLREWLVREAAPREEAPQSGGDSPVLIVGGAGYIGSILCRKLLAAGSRVRVLDSLIYGDSAIRDLYSNPRFELVTGDCRHIQSVVASLKDVRSVVHLAAIVGDPACEQNRQSALEINYAATRMLIEIARGNNVERFVFASSCSVYGATEHLMDERSDVQPISLYAETKVDSEKALLAARSDTFHPTILRFATVFGHSPRPRFDLVVNLLTAKAHKEGVITIYNGEQWRPFIHVADVAEGILAAVRADKELVSGEIFNVGDYRLNHTLSEIAGKIRHAFPETHVEHVENSDRRNYRVSFDKIRTRLGFECTLTVDEGIAEMKAAFQNHHVVDHTDVQYHNQRFLGQNGSPANQAPLDEHVMAAFARAN
ncbi:MAG TPA: SDR family oxidoreductase [Bryobacteraceae bacterium]|nr:SDR family oxidoreductase [Bryobacteraceae bacterium]